MGMYGLYVAGETRKDGEKRKDFVCIEAVSIDDALATLMGKYPNAKPAASNIAGHESHDAGKRRFSADGVSYRVQPTVATTKAPTKADVTREADILRGMVAVLAKKAKLTDATLAKLRADVEAAL